MEQMKAAVALFCTEEGESVMNEELVVSLTLNELLLIMLCCTFVDVDASASPLIEEEE